MRELCRLPNARFGTSVFGAERGVVELGHSCGYRFCYFFLQSFGSCAAAAARVRLSATRL